MLKKKQYCGFNGLHFPTVPRAPRSARVRGVHNRKLEDSQICAIEVLASLAGKLLQEGEGSSSSSNASEGSEPAFSVGTIKSERGNVQTPKSECLDRQSYGESVFVPDCASPDSDKKCLVKEFHPAERDSILDHSSLMIKSANSGKVSDDLKSGICDSLVGFESSQGKVEGGHGEFPDSCESSGGYVGNEFSTEGKASDPEGRVSNAYNSSGTKDPVDLCLKLCASVDSDHDVKLTTYGQPAPNSFTLRHNNIVKLGVRDDDEKFSRFNNPTTKTKGFRPSTRIGDRRIRKLLTSRYWKVAPKLKDSELSKIDGGMKSIHRKRKTCCSHERHQHDSLFKRRKFFDRIVVSSGFCSESLSNSHEKGMDIEKRRSAALFHGENGFSLGQKGAIHSKDSNVKFSIKSFKIPELLVEVPETATIGSLKKAVLKAVTDILGDGLHVGLHLHGKKVRDDNKTLLQTGIRSTENLDTLGFALEPSPLLALSPACAEGSPVPLTCDTSQHVTGSPATTNLDSIVSESLPDPPLLTKPANNTDSNHEFVASPTNITERNLLDSKALVIVPPPDAEPLGIASVTQKLKRSDVVQRRTRRPFSVAEVEALVRAVEELGTGRWRDVKLRSFENADHRTYVDLKDKWKTLVHTAKIAPQQRRGEPVPQELLDRVLAAHAYWLQHQVKQHGKNQAAIMKITESSCDINGGVEAINM